MLQSVRAEGLRWKQSLRGQELRKPGSEGRGRSSNFI